MKIRVGIGQLTLGAIIGSFFYFAPRYSVADTTEYRGDLLYRKEIKMSELTLNQRYRSVMRDLKDLRPDLQLTGKVCEAIKSLVSQGTMSVMDIAHIIDKGGLEIMSDDEMFIGGMK